MDSSSSFSSPTTREPNVSTTSSTARRDAVAGDGAAVELDLQHGSSRQLLDRYVGGAANRFQDRVDLHRLLLEDGEVVSVDLHADIGANAGDHLVDAHFDGLRGDGAHAGKNRELLLNRRGELLLCRSAFPAHTVRQRHEHIGDFEAHWVGVDLRRA